MKRRTSIFAIGGFLAGTIGLFALAALSLLSPIIETIAAPFLWPGRMLAAHYVGMEGSNAEILLLTLFNGILYTLIALVIEYATRSK